MKTLILSGTTLLAIAGVLLIKTSEKSKAVSKIKKITFETAQPKKIDSAALSNQQLPATKYQANEIDKRLFDKQSVLLIQNLSKKIFRSDSEQSTLDRALLNSDLMSKILVTLSDPKLLTSSKFSERIQYLDVMYEGLKSRNKMVLENYLSMAGDILSSEATDQIKSDKLAYQQFVGDRVELALALTKMNKGFPREIKNNYAKNPKQAAAYLSRAKDLESIYEVAL